MSAKTALVLSVTGQKRVRVFGASAGLAITAGLPGDRRYTITHLASGFGIGTFDRIGTARGVMAKLAAAPIDWQIPAERLRPRVNGSKRLRAAIARAIDPICRCGEFMEMHEWGRGRCGACACKRFRFSPEAQ